jgi:hypothetical protein
MGVESRSVQGRSFRYILDRDVVETLLIQQLAKSALQQLARPADAWI